ncbi:MAG: isoprenylcysteine carboxylmethyltransferase family protein [Croceibacterium sp.]
MPAVNLTIALALWVVWLVSWQVAALWRHEPTSTAPRTTWRWYIVIVAVGMVMLFTDRQILSARLWTAGPVTGWAMDALIAASFAFAWWARLTMGRLWSGGVGRTEAHRVVQEGPFAWVRHPIYCALIAAGLALAVIKGTPLAFTGTALVAIGFGLKARVEERFLSSELSGYPDYQRRVPMLIPRPPRRYSSRLS